MRHKSLKQIRAERNIDIQVSRLLSHMEAEAQIIRLLPEPEAQTRAIEALRKWTLRSGSITQGDVWDIITHVRHGGVLLEHFGEMIH